MKNIGLKSLPIFILWHAMLIGSKYFLLELLRLQNLLNFDLKLEDLNEKDLI